MKRLEKSYNKKITGVCGGVAEYLDMDPTLVRVGTVLAGVVTGFFPIIPIYIISAMLMPAPKSYSL